jgi:circadian clock protein KaiC
MSASSDHPPVAANAVVTSDASRVERGAIEKAQTGISGFDEITHGGLPCRRTTLVVGGPGAGKTVFALEALVNGARHHHEPAIFVAFEENSRQIVANAATFGWDLPALEREQLFFLDAQLPAAVVRDGPFDLVAMLAALDAKVEAMGARRIVLDGLDVLLTVLGDPIAERREVYRIQEWLHRRDLTAVITAKSDAGDRLSSERYAFLQFMVDCVVVLQNRLIDRVALRTLRLLKYRGSSFAEGEFPMVISADGIDVGTFAAPALAREAAHERISSGLPRLDAMLGGGYFRESVTLITGAPGTAKTTLAGAFVAAACARGERALFVSFDESGSQIARNLRSVRIDLRAPRAAGLLEIYAVRTEARGAEEHLVHLRRLLDTQRPSVLVVDPISALAKSGGQMAATHAALRLLDAARARGITVLCTSLVNGADALEETTMMQISTIADTWMQLAYVVHGGERNRTLTIIKSRGTRHSNQVRELVRGDDGVTLAEVYAARGEVLVGTARWEREEEERADERRRAADAARRRAQMEHAEAETTARIAALEHELEYRRAELALAEDEESARRSQGSALRRQRLERRGASAPAQADSPDDDGDAGITRAPAHG